MNCELRAESAVEDEIRRAARSIRDHNKLH